MNPLAVEAIGLSKSFPGGVNAVNGLSLSIQPGTVYGLVGRNGAGKTTTLRLLMGLLRPSSGTARLLGRSMASAPWPHRARVAYVSQEQRLHGWMTLMQMCRYVAHFYPTWDWDHAGRITRRFGLPWDRPLGVLSGGEQRKAAMLLAFSARPEVLILDEPAAGLDPIARRQFIDEIVSLLSDGGIRTVLLSTHILSDLERLADQVGILDHGVMIRESDLDTLKERFRKVQIIFGNGGPPAGFQIPGTLRQTIEGAVLTAVAELPSPDALDSLRCQPGLRLTEIPIGLEDLMIELLATQEERDEILMEAKSA